MGRHSQDRRNDEGLDLITGSFPLTPNQWRKDTYYGFEYYRLPSGDDITIARATRRERVKIWLLGLAAVVILVAAWVVVTLFVIGAGEWMLDA